MNEREKLTELVEYKIGKVLRRDVKKSVKTEESVFNVEEYSKKLYETYFLDKNDAGHWKSSSLGGSVKLDFNDYYLMDSFSQDFSDDEECYFQSPSLDNVIVNLQSRLEETQLRGLHALQTASAEELVSQKSWPQARKRLHDLLKSSTSESVKIQILELFRRFLSSKDNPKVVFEAFTSLAECITFDIGMINACQCKKLPKEICDKQNERAMWLLVQSQRGIPLKWSRFNEKRLKEIIFSFIHMLSSNILFKDSHICSLEVLSILDPKAIWCKNWCHGATGRSLLCTALKTYKKVFTEMVYFIFRITYNNPINLNSSTSLCVNLKLPPLNENTAIPNDLSEGRDEKKSPNKNKSSKKKYSAKSTVRCEKAAKGNRSAPPFPSNEYLNNIFGSSINSVNSYYMLKGLSKQVVSEATFCHCLSTVAYLIQCRSGRTLFPIYMTFRKRRITISDFVSTTLNHIANDSFYANREQLITDEYKAHMEKLIGILKSS